MRKQFSFKEFLLYALRYWVITVVCVVIGLGVAGFFAMRARPNVVRYQGQAELAGISTLYPKAPETEKETTNVYNTVCNHAMSAMSLDSNISKLYNVLGGEYCTLMRIKNKNEGELSFYKAFSFTTTTVAFKVAFTMPQNAANAAFCEKAVNEYLDIAIASAQERERVLSEDEDGNKRDGITKRNAERVAMPSQPLLSLLIPKAIVGGACGLLGGLLVSLIVFYIDPRILSYSDIAFVTGRRLLSAGKGETDESTCPKIDSVMGDDRLLLIGGDAAPCERIALLYGKYVAKERGAVVVLFGSANENGQSSLAAFLSGQAIESCVEKEDDLSVLRAGNEKLTLADATKLSALAEKYGRVVFAKAYASDGVTAVLAKVADKVVYAYDYKTARVKNAYALSAETGAPGKAAGACIENTGLGFVGSVAYIGEEDASL